MPDQAMMKAALQAYVDRINTSDTPGIVALFAPNAAIEDPVGTPVKQGEAIQAWLADTAAFATRISPVAPVRGPHGNEAAPAFDVEFTPPNNQRLKIRSVDICRFDDQGLITSLRAFWEPDDIELAN